MADDGINLGDIAKAAVAIALAVAAQEGLNAVFGAKNKTSVSQFFPSQVSSSPAYIMVGGWSKTPGLQVFKSVAGNAYGFIQAIHNGRIDGITRWYLGGDYVSIDGSGWVVGVNGETRSSHMDGRYIDQKVKLLSRLGAIPETAYAEFVSLFPSIWTSNHRGDGKASIAMLLFAPEAKFFAQAFPVGVPALAAVSRPGDIYDWRKDSTVLGGSGAQRRATPSTWGPCSNALVNRVHLEWFRWGRSWDRCIAPVLADLTVEANKCDDPVRISHMRSVLTLDAGSGSTAIHLASAAGIVSGTSINIGDQTLTVSGSPSSDGSGGYLVSLSTALDQTLLINSRVTWVCDPSVTVTEPRYSCAGNYVDDANRDDVRNKLTACMDGFFTTDRLGRIIVKCGHYEAPTFVLTADYIEDYTWSRGVSRDARVSKLNVTFTDPDSDYNEVPCDPWVIDNAGNKPAPLSLPWVTSFSQARRLAKRAASRVNPAYTGQVKTGPYGFLGLGQRYIRIQNPAEASMADVVCEVTNAEFDPVTGQVVFDVVSADPNIDAWNAATEEGSPVSTAGRAAATALMTPTITSATAVYNDTSTATITIVTAGPSRTDITWSGRWQYHGATAWNEFTDTSATGSTATLTTGTVPTNVSGGIDVEVSYATAGGSPSDWSATTNVSTSTSAIAPGPVTVPAATTGTAAGKIDLTWRNPGSSNFDHVVIRRSLASGMTSSTTVATLPGSPGQDYRSTPYTDTGLTTGTTYYYDFTAYNASGTPSTATTPVSAVAA